MFCLDWIGRIQTIEWLSEKVGAGHLVREAGSTILGVIGLGAIGIGVWDFFQDRRRRRWAKAHTKTEVVRFKYVPLNHQKDDQSQPPPSAQ